MNVLSDKLKELRKNKGVTQYEIAESLGMSKATYSTYETGKREPKIDTLIRLASYYHVTLDYLLTKSDSEADNALTTHFNSNEFTRDEINEIKQFAEFVKSKRKDSLFNNSSEL